MVAVLAQLNIASLGAPLDSQQLEGFVSRLDEINALADNADGFVWRLTTEAGNATSIQAFDDPDLISNLSLWRDLDALKAYVYQSPHLELLKKKRDWFKPLDDAHLVLWWVAHGHEPELEESKARLEALRGNGSGPFAFNFANPWPAPFALLFDASYNQHSDVMPVVEKDYSAVTDLLRRCELDVSDISEDAWRHEHQAYFVKIQNADGNVVACGGIEILGNTGLLRSIAVGSDSRSRGYGKSIVSRLESLANQAGLERLFALTETASTYFGEQHYLSLDRDDAPAELQKTAQFSSLCSPDAQCLFKDLRTL